MPTVSRPPLAAVFAGLMLVAAAFMVWLGTVAAAFHVTAVALVLAAVLLWTGKAPKLFRGILLANQAFGLLLFVAVAYRKFAMPFETVTLALSGIGLVGNMLLGGPFLAILSIPVLGHLHFGQSLKTWLAPRAA